MKHVIHKQVLRIEDLNRYDELTLIVPAGTVFLSVGCQPIDQKMSLGSRVGEVPVIWYHFDRSEVAVRQRVLRIHGTGIVWEYTHMRFIGTILMGGGNLVLHVFDLARTLDGE